MTNQRIKLAGLIVTCAVITACDRDFSDPLDDRSNFNSGTADFSQFVSIGDSLTAGYGDRALYKSGQENSYPAILAQQFAKVGGGTFTQPLMNDNLGGLLVGGNVILDADGDPDFQNRLVLNATTRSPEPIEGAPSTDALNVLSGSFNNMGVPGAKSFLLRSTSYGDPAGLAADPVTANPYFVRFASASDTSIIADAAAQSASFFVMWVGGNDVWAYAASGGIGINQLGNTNPDTYGSKDITDPVAFEGVYTQLVAAMTTADAKGVLINIPDVGTIPFFTTIPHNPVPLDQATADTLNAAYAAYNGGVQAALGLGLINSDEAAQRTISFAVGQNAVVILDEDLTDIRGVDTALTKRRQATTNDLMVLPSRSKIGTLADVNNPLSAWGLAVPLEDGDVLTALEIKAVDDARQAFNASIELIANNNDNLLFFDAAALMTELSTTGIDYGVGSVNAAYATGGGFSLDGVHPTSRFYSIIANRIIDAINSGFDANIPGVNPGDYRTIFVK